MERTSGRDLLRRAEAAEIKAGRTDDGDRRADLLQLAILLRWLADHDRAAGSALNSAVRDADNKHSL